MYLSKIYIKNFRGIKELLVEFDKTDLAHLKGKVALFDWNSGTIRGEKWHYSHGCKVGRPDLQRRP